MSHKHETTLLDTLKVPSYMTLMMDDNPSGVSGWLVDLRVDGFIHIKGMPDSEYAPHSWSQSVLFGDKPRYGQLMRLVDMWPGNLNDIADYYYEYEYDEQGNRVDGSKRKIVFDRWMLTVEGKPKSGME